MGGFKPSLYLSNYMLIIVFLRLLRNSPLSVAKLLDQRMPNPTSPSPDWLFPPPGTPAGTPGLLYSLRVENFLQSFCDPVNPHAPKQPFDVVPDLARIWQAQGFIGVEDLTAQLLKRYNPDLPDPALEILHRRLADRLNNEEPLTGYKRKQFAPLVTGLAHLFGVLTATPVCVVEGDMSNMGNTNQHFRNLMALAQGVPLSAIPDLPDTPAYQCTDQATRVVCGLVQKKLEQHGVTVRGFRSGGDEIRLILFGATAAQAQQLIDRDVMPAVEEFTAQAGLQDHEYGKLGKLRLRSGFGLGLIPFDLNAATRPALDPRRAEQKLDYRKLEQGQARRGRLGPLALPSDTEEADLLELAARSGYLKKTYTSLAKAAPELRQKLMASVTLDPAQAKRARLNDLFSLLQTEMAQHLLTQAQSSRAHFQSLKRAAGSLYPPQHAPTDHDPADPTPTYQLTQPQAAAQLTAFTRLIEGPYAGYLSENARETDAAPVFDRDGAFLLPQQRELIALQRDLRAAHLLVTPPCLVKVLGMVSPIDPSTATLMGDVMPNVFGQFANDTAALVQMGELPAQAQSWGIAAFMHNLAGANGLLGSEVANAVLYSFAHDVVLGSFLALGFRDEQVVAGHLGGGKLVLAVPPLLATRDGETQLTTPTLIRQIQTEMQSCIKDWQKVNLAEFLDSHGFVVPADFDRRLCIGDITDRRRPEYPGLDLTSHALALQTVDASGGRIFGGASLRRLEAETEARIHAKRIARQKAYDPPAPG